jgi:hypothetical protein
VGDERIKLFTRVVQPTVTMKKLESKEPQREEERSTDQVMEVV